MISSMERYPSAFAKSQRILDFCQCSFYPLDIHGIIEAFLSKKIIIMPETIYKQYRKETRETRPYIRIKDGRTYYDVERDLYLIIYNDRRPKNRTRFTLAHEFAHIILEHLSDERTEIDRGGLPDYIYYSYEGAANTFAGNFLAPPIIISEKMQGKPFNSHSVASMFNISVDAARSYRNADYEFWKTQSRSNVELLILNRYRKRTIATKCEMCGHIQLIRHATFCQICGNKIKPLRAGDDEKMGKKYAGVELDKNLRAIVCPICENEEHFDDAGICMICGTDLKNRCVSAISLNDYEEPCAHYEPLPGNARYCPYCGSKTTFFANGALPAWNAPAINDEFLFEDNAKLPF